MKKFLMSMGIMLVSAFCLFDGYAAEKETVNWKKIAESGDGVYRVKTDEKGVVKSFVAVGSARVSKALGKIKGKRIAQKSARLQAKAEIVKWIKSQVKSYETSGSETIITLAGDGNNISEKGKSAEKNTAKIEEFAEGIVRGTTVLYTDIQTTDDEQEFVIILGWSSKNVKSVRQVRSIMADESPAQKASVDKEKSPSAKGKKSNLLPEKTTISDEAADY